MTKSKAAAAATAGVEEVLCHRVAFTRNGKEYKSVMFRESKISDNERAIRSAAGRLGKNPSGMLEQYVVNVELLKLLIVKVNDQKVDRSRLEALDGMFTNKEFKIIQQRLMEIEGDADGEAGDNPLGSTVEIVTSGGQ